MIDEICAPTRRLGVPGDDPEVLKDGFTLLVRLRPAPVVARVAAVTALVRTDVLGNFRRADEVSRFLAGRGPLVDVDAALALLGRPAGGFRVELRALHSVCWSRVRDLYRTRTPPRP